MYKVFNEVSPEYLKLSFKDRSNSYQDRLRSSSRNVLDVPKHRTHMFTKAFSYAGAKAWNSIPKDIRESSTLQIFKYRLKAHLLNMPN